MRLATVPHVVTVRLAAACNGHACCLLALWVDRCDRTATMNGHDALRCLREPGRTGVLAPCRPCLARCCCGRIQLWAGCEPLFLGNPPAPRLRRALLFFSSWPLSLTLGSYTLGVQYAWHHQVWPKLFASNALATTWRLPNVQGQG